MIFVVLQLIRRFCTILILNHYIKENTSYILHVNETSWKWYVSLIRQRKVERSTESCF